jgi:hypothetical protein
MPTAIEVRVVRRGDPAPFPDLATRRVHAVNLDRAVLLEAGTEGGRASVALIAELPDGSVAMIETTAALFMTLAGAVRGGCASWGEQV